MARPAKQPASQDTHAYLQARLRQLPVFARELIAGGFAGALAKTCVAPLERTKIIFQTRGGVGMTVGGVLSYIWQQEGLRGLFRGNSASVMRIIPYAAIHFGLYEHYRRGIIQFALPDSEAGSREQGIALWDLLAGSASGATAVLATYPLDLVRTRLAWASEAPATSGAAPHHRLGIASQLATTVSEEGFIGLYRGCTPTLLGILPYAGLKFYVYQALKNHYRAWSAAGSEETGAAAVSGNDVGSSSSSRHHERLQEQQMQQQQDCSAQASSDSGHSSSSSASIGAAGTAVDSSPTVVDQAALAHTQAHQKQQQHQQEGPAAPREKLPLVVSLLFGGIAGLAAQTVTYPLDVVRRQMQVAHLKLAPHTPDTASDAASSSRLQQHHAATVHKQVDPQQLRQQPQNAVPAADPTSSQSTRSCSLLSAVSDRSRSRGPQYIHTRAGAGFVQIATAAPQSTRSMAHRSAVHDLLHPEATMRSVTRQLLAEGGVRALFRGLSINYMKVVPSTAIGFTVYDAFKSYLGLTSTL